MNSKGKVQISYSQLEETRASLERANMKEEVVLEENEGMMRDDVNGMDESLDNNDLSIQDDDEKNGSDNEQPYVPHPLEQEWMFWATKSSQSAYECEEICSIKTIEDFWGVYNNVPPISSFSEKYWIALFKQGIQPKWEDPKNKDGSDLIFNLEEGFRGEMQEAWLQLLLLIIGATIKHRSPICGARFLKKKKGKGFDRLEIWTTSDDERKLLKEEMTKLIEGSWNWKERN